MSRRHRYLELLFLLGLALFVRLLYIKLYPADYLISSDGLTYSNIAENILQGKGFITTIRDRDYAVGPIYPLLIALTYLFFGIKNYFAVVILQAVISALTTVLAYLIGERLFGKAYAWIPYLLMLAYPMFSFWTMYILTETTYIFMITLFIWAVVFYSQNVQQGKKQLRSTLLLGVILGLGNLVRPILLLIFPVLFFWQWFLNNWKFKKALRDILLVGLAMSLV
ncbi:MAG: glycosyltransferase family 39 protein, partial [Desulfosporosinus sp.]